MVGFIELLEINNQNFKKKGFKMTKLELFNNVKNDVKDLVESYDIEDAFYKELSTMLAFYLEPKKDGVRGKLPKEIDGVMYYFCRFHQKYEAVEHMVMSKDKSKGYCKAAISLWNKTNARIKKLDSAAVDAMTNDDFDKAKGLAQEAKTLKETFNKPEFYDYDRDWAVFNGTEIPVKSENVQDIVKIERPSK